MKTSAAHVVGGIGLILSGCASTQPRMTSANVEATASSSTAKRQQGQVVPTLYDEDRFFARPIIAQTGETLNVYLDTGGNNVLYSDVVDRLHLQRVPRGQGQESWTEVLFPQLTQANSMPLPHTREGRVLVFDRGPTNEGWSGMLGPEWLGGRCWLFDYPGRQLVLVNECQQKQSSPHAVELGFGEGMFFPRIQVLVDGEILDLLFDTGAHTRLTPSAHATLADGRAAIRATSFITNSTFTKWKLNHPNWRVIEQAEAGSGEAMIEVPEVTIAGYTVGPVWFTRRADKNFHEFMSQWMDRRIEGALGGNALRFFRIVVDYPKKSALFEK